MRALIRSPRPSSNAPTDVKIEWLMDRIDEITTASQQEDLAIADPYQITNPVAALRTLDATGGTLANVLAVLSTLLDDMHKRGMNRGSG